MALLHFQVCFTRDGHVLNESISFPNVFGTAGSVSDTGSTLATLSINLLGLGLGFNRLPHCSTRLTGRYSQDLHVAARLRFARLGCLAAQIGRLTRHHKIGLNSVLLHRGHLPAASKETGFVKYFTYWHSLHSHRIARCSCDWSICFNAFMALSRIGSGDFREP